MSKLKFFTVFAVLCASLIAQETRIVSNNDGIAFQIALLKTEYTKCIKTGDSEKARYYMRLIQQLRKEIDNG